MSVLRTLIIFLLLGENCWEPASSFNCQIANIKVSKDRQEMYVVVEVRKNNIPKEIGWNVCL